MDSRRGGRAALVCPSPSCRSGRVGDCDLAPSGLLLRFALVLALLAVPRTATTANYLLHRLSGLLPRGDAFLSRGVGVSSDPGHCRFVFSPARDSITLGSRL